MVWSRPQPRCWPRCGRRATARCTPSRFLRATPDRSSSETFDGTIWPAAAGTQNDILFFIDPNLGASASTTELKETVEVIDPDGTTVLRIGRFDTMAMSNAGCPVSTPTA